MTYFIVPVSTSQKVMGWASTLWATSKKLGPSWQLDEASEDRNYLAGDQGVKLASNSTFAVPEVTCKHS